MRTRLLTQPRPKKNLLFKEAALLSRINSCPSKRRCDRRSEGVRSPSQSALKSHLPHQKTEERLRDFSSELVLESDKSQFEFQTLLALWLEQST